MYYSCIEIEYVATSFYLARTDLVVKLITFVYFWEVVSHHLHLLPQHHQSHLHLACLFTNHLCHLPHILPQFQLSGIMFLLIQIPMILKCIPYIT